MNETLKRILIVVAIYWSLMWLVCISGAFRRLFDGTLRYYTGKKRR